MDPILILTFPLFHGMILAAVIFLLTFNLIFSLVLFRMYSEHQTERSFFDPILPV